MRSALLLGVSTLLIAAAVGAPIPPPTAREATQLIEKLGSEDYAEREAASKRLDDLGLLALAELRAATKSDNAEIADRAKDLVRKIERRASNDRALAPTIVELNLKDATLDAVLAELSKQAGCEVVLDGLKADELAAKKITVATTGKVTFWAAVLKVCDAGGLQIAGAGGFYSAGSAPYTVIRPANGVARRVAANPNSAVILEAREGKKRPASVHGGVLVEAFEVPQASSTRLFASAVLQVWPESKLGWQYAADVKVTNALDNKGGKVLPDLTHVGARPQVKPVPGGKVVVVQNADGTITIVNPDAKNPVMVGAPFTPNVRQALVKLKTGPGTASELTGSVYGLVRSPPEPLVTIALVAKEEVSATGHADTATEASLRTDADGKRFVIVKLSYDPLKVHPARTGDDLADVKPAAGGNQTVHGLRVTDADGNAFDAALIRASNDFDPTRQGRIVLSMKLELPVVKDGPTLPTKLVFWGSYAKPVGVPFTLKDVSLVGGSK